MKCYLNLFLMKKNIQTTIFQTFVLLEFLNAANKKKSKQYKRIYGYNSTTCLKFSMKKKFLNYTRKKNHG